MIIFAGFAIALVVVVIGLHILPDLTTFFFCLLPVGLVLAGLAYTISALNLPVGVFVVVGALAGLLLLATLRTHRRTTLEAARHWTDQHEDFIIAQRRDEARYQRRMKQACPDTYTPGNPSNRARMACPPEWGHEIDWTQRPMDKREKR
jgi:hypothetical protein